MPSISDLLHGKQIHVSSKEIRQHKEFVANLDSPVWHKIDY